MPDCFPTSGGGGILVFPHNQEGNSMSETFQVKFACPDCGSESFKFSAEPHSMDNVESCASCGRTISRDDIVSHSRDFAKKQADEMVRKAFNGRLK